MTLTGCSSQGRMDLRVEEMDEYSPFPQAPETESHHQIQISVSAGNYSWCIINPTDKVEIFGDKWLLKIHESIL